MLSIDHPAEKIHFTLFDHAYYQIVRDRCSGNETTNDIGNIDATSAIIKVKYIIRFLLKIFYYVLKSMKGENNRLYRKIRLKNLA